MQNIEIRLEDENGNIVERSDVNFASLLDSFWKKFNDRESATKEYPWLATIDPYGNTVLNPSQIELVVKELNCLNKSLKQQTLSEEIQKVSCFLIKANIHQYIKFLGD